MILGPDGKEIRTLKAGEVCPLRLSMGFVKQPLRAIVQDKIEQPGAPQTAHSIYWPGWWW